METYSMQLGKASEEEITKLLNLCQQLEAFGKELNHTLFEDIDISEEKEFFTILSPISERCSNVEDFTELILNEFSNVHYSRILLNLTTLLDNCADENLNILDFNKEIKDGGEALDLLKRINESEQLDQFDDDLIKSIKSLLGEDK